MIGLDSPTVEVWVATLGWTLLHFLWQGAVVGVFFGVALAAAGNASAQTRYRLALFFLLLLAAAPVATFIWLSPHYASGAAAATDTLPTSVTILPATGGASAADWAARIQPWLPWAVLIWAAGVTFMTGRLLIEWRNVQRLTRVDVAPLTLAWQHRVQRLMASLGVRSVVRAVQSTRVHVPMVVGWLRPIVLVPASALTGLTTWQLELILMHEFAHIRRYDHLVNLLQVVIETLLFYHPVVRWVSRVMRAEREHCCDDLVVACSGDALGYARALTELAGVQSLSLQTSVSSDGGQLLVRIRRLVGARREPRLAAHWSIGVMLAMLAVSVSGLLQPLGGESRARDGVTESRWSGGEQRAPEAISRTVEDRAHARETGFPPSASGGGTEQSPRAAIPQPLPPLLVPQAEPRVAGSAMPRGDSNQSTAPLAGSTQPAGGVEGRSPGAVQSDPPGAQGAPTAAPAQTATPRSETPERKSVAAAAEPSPAESVLVTAPAESAVGSLAPGSVVDRARMAAVDRVAQENGVKLVWLNPPVLGNESGLAPQVGLESDDPAGDTGEAHAARAIAILQPQPEFPARAREDSIEGWVTVSYVIGRDGRVSNVAIVAAQPRNVFESAVRRAVRSWRFKPVIIDGEAVEQEKTQTIRFSLSDGQPFSEELCTVSTGSRICRQATR